MTLAPERPVDDPDDLARMTLVEHLAELRTRLIRSALALAVGAAGGFVIANRVLSFLVDPYCEAKEGDECALVVIDPLEGFTTRVKIALFVGGVVAAPVVLWQLWRFVTPALHKNEKRYAIPFILSSMVLFVGGAGLAVLTFPRALDFLISIGGPDLVPLFSPSKYLNLYLKVVLAFGVAFEFPILLVFLQLARILNPRQLRRARRGMIVGIVVFAAVITPSQDPITLLAMAVPMYVLFEVAIVIGKLFKR
ncbi:MAG TPA: twin-arginine translocase subunit TatC [Acidimicrobiales bacterium]|nr:twin-arginine translocase subunit TatC [Acidimicrobiales bacterium]